MHRTNRERWLLEATNRHMAKKARRRRVAQFLSSLRYGLEDWLLDRRPV